MAGHFALCLVARLDAGGAICEFAFGMLTYPLMVFLPTLFTTISGECGCREIEEDRARSWRDFSFQNVLSSTVTAALNGALSLTRLQFDGDVADLLGLFLPTMVNST